MGSGYIMNAAVLQAMKTLSPEENKRALEALGTNFLIDTFSDQEYEDFQTRSKEGAELVKTAVERSFKQRYGENYPFSVDIQENNGVFKISFFK